MAQQGANMSIGQGESAAARQVFLFSGHMVDAADRSEPRFPPDKESLAAAAIGALLDQLGAGADDAAISSAACGGDLLFAEACLRRGLRVEIYLPFAEQQFLQESVNFAGEHWRRMFFSVKARVRDWHIMPLELAPTPEGEDPFARVNLWMLNHAVVYGSQNIRFICLWDRKVGDGPGGTKHLHDVVVQGSGQAYVLDTTKLW